MVFFSNKKRKFCGENNNKGSESCIFVYDSLDHIMFGKFLNKFLRVSTLKNLPDNSKPECIKTPKILYLKRLIKCKKSEITQKFKVFVRDIEFFVKTLLI